MRRCGDPVDFDDRRPLLGFGLKELADRRLEGLPASHIRLLPVPIISVDSRGVEPRSPGCKPGVFPLLRAALFTEFRQGPPGSRTRTTPLPQGRAAGNTCGPEIVQSSRQDSNLRYPACKAGVLAARRRDENKADQIRSVAEVGVEPTSTSLSSWRLCRFAYSAESDCRSGSRTQGPGL
jgi:hypothetical protein